MEKHVIKCGDAGKLMKSVKDKSVDVVFTDPPYKDYQSMRVEERQKKIEVGGFSWDHLFQDISRVLKPGRHFYVWCCNRSYKDAYEALEKTKGLKYKNMIIWVKSNHGSGDLKSGYAPQHEICIYGHKGNGRHFEKGTKRISDVLYKKNDDGCIGFYKKVSPKKGGHPTIKPVEIIEEMLKRSSKKNEIVLDPYGGSFSTMKACMNLGRRSITFELDKEYCKLGKKVRTKKSPNERI